MAAQRMVKQMLFRYQGHIGTYLIMGGVDVTGPALYEIAAHGSTSKVNNYSISTNIISSADFVFQYLILSRFPSVPWDQEHWLPCQFWSHSKLSKEQKFDRRCSQVYFQLEA